MRLVYLAHMALPNQRAHACQIMEMCGAFAGSGIEVRLLFAEDWGSLPRGRANVWEGCGVPPRFEIDGLSSVDLAPLGAWLPGKLRQVWARLAWTVSLATFSVSAVIRLRADRESMVYSRDALPLALLACLRRERASHLFFEAHTTPTSRAGRWLRGRLANAIGGFVMVTDHLRQRHEAIGVSPRQAIVAHDGVRLERFAVHDDRAAARSRLGWPEAAFIVGYLGRTRTLGMDKGVLALIQAAELLGREGHLRPMLAVLVGPSHAELQELVGRDGRQGLADLVTATGWVQPAEVPLHLRAMDACVLPLPWTEHFAFEASPMKLFEYMASGTPIVASNLPAVAELLRDGENGLLVPPSDVPSLAGALRRLRDERGLAERLARQAAQDVRSFTWDARAGRILEMMAAPHAGAADSRSEQNRLG